MGDDAEKVLEIDPFRRDLLINAAAGLLVCVPSPVLGELATTAAQATVESGSRPLKYSKRGDRNMEIKRNGSQPSVQGSDEYFTGRVRVDPLFDAPEPARVLGASVTVEPGSRTAWHTHPLGQTLIVTSGVGWTQCWGESKVEIHPGDVIWCPPGKKHWHGATPTMAMTHIAIVEKLDGKSADWMEKVSDEQYRA